jgi:RimJ/RimL family protein N-acetyltransferase
VPSDRGAHPADLMAPAGTRGAMEPADGTRAEAFAASLPDHPFTFSARSVLRRGTGSVWLDGDSSDPAAAVVLSSAQPTEPMAFGPDVDALWGLLRKLPGWTCVHLASEDAPRLARALERELRAPTRIYADIYYVLDHPPAPLRHGSVRRLTEDDLEMVERAPHELRPTGYLSVLAALSGSVVAGGIVGGELVARVSMTDSSEDFADIGSYTLEPWRNRGLASAAGSLVATEVFSRGMTPVWSTGEDNVRSQRVALKLGFREFGRQAYVIVPKLQESGGFRVAASTGLH